MKAEKGSSLHLTLEEKVLLVLNEYRLSEGSYTAPQETTQDGLAAQVNVLRPSLLRAIKAMEGRGLVRRDKCHIDGINRKKIVYALTDEGLREALALKEKLYNMPISEEDSDGNTLGSIYKKSGHKSQPFHEFVFSLESGNDSKEGTTKKNGTSITYNYLPEVDSFFGRQNEMTKLKNALVSKNISLIQIHGIPGIGKTTLIARAVRAYSPYSRVFWYTTLPVNSPTSMLLEMCSFIGGNMARAGERLLNGNIDPSAVLSLLERAISKKGDGLLIVIDDLQNAESEMMGLVKTLALMSMRSGKMKMIVISRVNADLLDIRFKPRRITLEIKGVDMKAAGNITGGMSGERLREAYNITKGHPLALRIIARSGGESGDIRDFFYTEGISRLPEREKELISILSLIRAPCRYEYLEHHLKGEGWREALYSLLRRGYIRIEGIAGDKLYKLLDVLGDTMQMHLDSSQKKEIHMTLAMYYEDMYNEEDSAMQLVEIGTERAYHLMEAGDARQALEVIAAVGELGISLDYLPLFAIIDKLDSMKLDKNGKWKLSILKADAEAHLGNIDKSMAMYTKSLEEALYTPERNKKAKAEIYSKMSRIMNMKGEWKATLELEMKALEEGVEAGDEEAQARSHHNIGTTYLKWYMASGGKDRKKLNKAIKNLKEAAHLFKKKGLKKTAAMSMINLYRAFKYAKMGREAEKTLEEAHNLAVAGTTSWFAVRSVMVYEALSSNDEEKALGIFEEMIKGHNIQPDIILDAASSLLSQGDDDGINMALEGVRAVLTKKGVRDRGLFSAGVQSSDVKSDMLFSFWLRAMEALEGSKQCRAHLGIDGLESLREDILGHLGELEPERKALEITRYASLMTAYGNYQKATEYYRQALKIITKQKDMQEQEAIIRYKLAESILGQDEKDRARREFKNALKLAEQQGMKELTKRCIRRLKGL